MKLQQYPLVKIDPKVIEMLHKRHDSCYDPFIGKTFILLGEIKQMEGHCILVNIISGEILSCYHTEDFIELTEEEV